MVEQVSLLAGESPSNSSVHWTLLCSWWKWKEVQSSYGRLPPFKIWHFKIWYLFSDNADRWTTTSISRLLFSDIADRWRITSTTGFMFSDNADRWRSLPHSHFLGWKEVHDNPTPGTCQFNLVARDLSCILAEDSPTDANPSPNIFLRSTSAVSLFMLESAIFTARCRAVFPSLLVVDKINHLSGCVFHTGRYLIH